MSDVDNVDVWLAHWYEQAEAMGSPPIVLERIQTVREIASSDLPDRDEICLELIAGLGRFYEAAIRRAGDVELADRIGRWASSLEVWLRMSPEMRALAGRPLDEL